MLKQSETSHEVHQESDLRGQVEELMNSSQLKSVHKRHAGFSVTLRKVGHVSLRLTCEFDQDTRSSPDQRPPQRSDSPHHAFISFILSRLKRTKVSNTKREKSASSFR